MTKNLTNVQLEKMEFFWSKLSVYLFLGLHKDAQATEEHSALENMKFLNFFLFSLVIFALLDPEPDPNPLTWLNTDPIRIRNTATNTVQNKQVV